MDYQYNSADKHNLAMETAAITLSFLALVSCTCIYASIILGTLAVIFAILSKGGAETMSPRAKLAMWIGIIGIVLTILLFVVAFVTAYLEYGSLENMLKVYSQMTGTDLQSLFPELAQ